MWAVGERITMVPCKLYYAISLRVQVQYYPPPSKIRNLLSILITQSAFFKKQVTPFF